MPMCTFKFHQILTSLAATILDKSRNITVIVVGE